MDYHSVKPLPSDVTTNSNNKGGLVINGSNASTMQCFFVLPNIDGTTFRMPSSLSFLVPIGTSTIIPFNFVSWSVSSGTGSVYEIF